jgi:hypothetical protein
MRLEGRQPIVFGALRRSLKANSVSPLFSLLCGACGSVALKVEARPAAWLFFVQKSKNELRSSEYGCRSHKRPHNSNLQPDPVSGELCQMLILWRYCQSTTEVALWRYGRAVACGYGWSFSALFILANFISLWRQVSREGKALSQRGTFGVEIAKSTDFISLRCEHPHVPELFVRSHWKKTYSMKNRKRKIIPH